MNERGAAGSSGMKSLLDKKPHEITHLPPASDDDNIVSFPCIFALIITTHLWRREMSSSCSETYFAQILQVASSFGCPLRVLRAQKFDEKGQKTTKCKQ